MNGPIHELLDGINNISLLPPLAYQELIFLARSSYFVMTDSGGLQEELPSMGKPALVLRNVDMYPLLKFGLAVLIAVPLSFVLGNLIRKLPYTDRVL